MTHVPFPYVLPLSCQLDGNHALHVAGTFWDMVTKIVLRTMPFRNEKELVLTILFN